MNIRKVASIGLAVVLQVLPITRVFLPAAASSGSSFAIVSTWIAGALALLGGVDAVSGASSISVSPATATTGVPYSGVVQYSGAHASSAKSWQLTQSWAGAQTGCGTVYQIAPGLWLTNISSYLARVGGTPTTSGTFNFTMKIWSGTSCGGGDSDTRSSSIIIAAGTVTAPSITTQPTSQTVTAGGAATFTVAASGTAPLTYQWRLNGANVGGGTSATLSLTAVTTNQAGSYTCVVSNSAGTATSSAATLTVNAPAVVAPAITSQPASQTITEGGSASFTVGASGTAPLTYQWRLNGANVGGATSATLTLTSVTTNQAGSYTCVVSNSAGTATSGAATLTVNAAVVAPAITSQPSSQTVTAGANVNFTVGASGTAPLAYQWRLNGANIGGANSATLALTAVTTNQAGNYTCVVSNSAGTATSSAATLTVNAAVVAPAITSQPSSQTVTAGANVNFTVGASGTAPLVYQWRLNGANIGGANSATLALTAVTTNQAGNYTCVVSNSAGTATSSAATLTVNAAVVAPAITSQPANQTITEGGSASFVVGASGTAPLTYQWRLNGANIVGATSATLVLTAVTTNQAGSYTCVVSNSAGTATSSAATLTVNAAVVAPAITSQPVSQSVTAGANVSFTVAASGTAPLTYQWKFNGANIGGGTAATLSLPAVTTNQAGSYVCVVSNSAGIAISSAATLSVTAAAVAPSITSQPASQTITEGGSASFTVGASGTGPLSYQWKFNGANVGGGTSATLSLTSVTTNQAGSYTCVVSNSAGTASSAAATLTVNVAVIAPAITSQPTSQTVVAGANVSFNVAASGTAPLTYQWRLNGANVGGATSATLSLTSVTTNQAGSYTCVVSNSAGTATSIAATLTVNAAVIAPAITSQPASQIVTEGANVNFTVGASGTGPLAYQWKLNGANVGGATSATLSLTSVTTNQAGSYTCVVSNSAGTATSSAATLTVNAAVIAPAITSQPASQIVTEGANVNFTVGASGTGPLVYQWRLNGANVGGATSATLSLTSVTTNQAGSYTCVVSNSAGTATSIAATLTVNAAVIAPAITSQPASQTVAAGANVSFAVGASGTGPLTYQWRRNGANVGGGTSATLSLTSVTTNQAGSYTCVVSNSAGTATSSAATLTVNVLTQTATLTVTKQGQGTLVPDLNGSSLVVGQSYTITATPALGYQFAGWSGGLSSMATTLTFTMSAGLQLQANFVTDPFTAAAGTYNGLFYENAEVMLRSAGGFNVYSDTAGNYSGWFQIGYARYMFAGKLDANLNATNTVTRWNGSPVTVELHIGQNAAAGQITGRVTDGIWVAQLTGGRSSGNSLHAGAYTIVLPGVVGDPRIPAGDGYGTLVVGTDGLGTLNGTLADGTQFSQTAYVTDDGSWPVYVSLYTGRGAVVSWLTFNNLSTSDVSGNLVWLKTPGASATSYPAGFTNETAAIGSAYVAPTASGNALNLSGGVVNFSGGGLAASFNNVISVNAGSQVVNLSPNNLTLSISTGNGLFTGQVTEPGTGVIRTFGGAILQKQNAGHGATAGTTSSRVLLGAP